MGEDIREMLCVRERGNGQRWVHGLLEKGCGGSCCLLSGDCVINSKTSSVEEGPPDEPVTGETPPMMRHAETCDDVGEIDKEEYRDGNFVWEHGEDVYEVVRGGRDDRDEGSQRTYTALDADIDVAPLVFDQFALFTIERFVGYFVRDLWPVFLAQHASGLLSRRDECALEAGKESLCGGLGKIVLRGREIILAALSPAVRRRWEERESFSGFLGRRTRNQCLVSCW